jgi:hypothetical protein
MNFTILPVEEFADLATPAAKLAMEISKQIVSAAKAVKS